MPTIFVTDRAGNERCVEGVENRTLMETIRDANFDDLLALCGGVCSCATCHVFVDSNFAGILPPMSQDEYDLLDASDHRDERSRLSCQIKLSPELAGLRVTIAPEG